MSAKSGVPARADRQGRCTISTPNDILRAHFVIETAQQHGITFAIENGKLAVEFPLNIAPAFWAQLQGAILANKQAIANYIYTRERQPERVL